MFEIVLIISLYYILIALVCFGGGVLPFEERDNLNDTWYQIRSLVYTDVHYNSSLTFGNIIHHMCLD